MKSTRAFTKVPRLLAAAAVMSTLAVGAMVATSAPAFAGTLGSPSWTLSNNVPSATGVQYTLGFTTTSDQTNPVITFTFPAGTTNASSAPTLVSSYGLNGESAATAMTGNVLTITLSGDHVIPASQFVVFQVGGVGDDFTNTASTGSQSVGIDVASTDPAADDAGTASTTIAANTTTATVYVPQSLTLSNVTTAIGLTPLPGGSPVTAPVTMNVSTNAVGGYILSACLTTALTGPASWPTTSNSSSAAFGAGVSAFGAHATAAGSGAVGASGAPAPLSPFNGTGSNYVGYSSSCADGSNHNVVQDLVPASSDTITITNAAQASAVQAAGSYVGTITYQAAPSY